jgi:tRNA-binding EMAP/Myf-like protein
VTPTSRGVVAGLVVAVQDHPNADIIRIARVDINAGKQLQIVFGGPPIVTPGCLVPVAPPGSRVGIGSQERKMRRRTYRGTFSEGMLCSLAELGWDRNGPDEVALLKDVAPGELIDDFADGRWRAHRAPRAADSFGVWPPPALAAKIAAAPAPAALSRAPQMGPFQPAVFATDEPRNQKKRIPTFVTGGGISLVRDV